MKVVLTDEAQNDLSEIAAFIQPHNPQRALTFVDELLERCAALADTPRAFPLVPRYEYYEIRRSLYQDYLIFYRIRRDVLEIIHILHGARDYEALLFGDKA